jgi:hypothetical protein
MTKCWGCRICIENVGVPQRVERITVETGEDGRAQRPPCIGVLYQWNQGNAHGESEAVTFEAAQQLFQIAVTVIGRVLYEAFEAAEGLHRLTRVLGDG